MSKHQFKILSIDGGGIKGIIPCMILQYIESQVGPLHTKFDLMVGTSTGGIITLGLNTNKPEEDTPYTATEMLKLYEENGNIIFHQRQQSWLRTLLSKIRKIGVLFQKPYDNSDIETVLSKYFGNKRLKETQTKVLVPTYDIKSGKPFYYSTRLANNDDSEDCLIRDIARSTSAAPTFFTPHQVQNSIADKFSFVDGGVFANNPSLLGLAEAKAIWNSSVAKGQKAIIAGSDEDVPFFMLSIGTGLNLLTFSENDGRKWATWKWLEPLTQSIFMQSASENTKYIIEHLLPKYTDGSLRYKRFDVLLDKKLCVMDNASEENIKALKAVAQKYIEENESELLKICRLLR